MKFVIIANGPHSASPWCFVSSVSSGFIGLVGDVESAKKFSSKAKGDAWVRKYANSDDGKYRVVEEKAAVKLVDEENAAARKALEEELKAKAEEVRRLCPHIETSISEDDWEGMSLTNSCSLTGGSCPYVSMRHNTDSHVDHCPLPEFHKNPPQVPDAVCELIDDLVTECLRCDALAKHWYLSECIGCQCECAKSHLKLKYIAVQYRRRKAGKEGDGDGR